MKKHIFYSLLGFFIFSSSQVMADFTIPGTHCFLVSKDHLEYRNPYGGGVTPLYDETNAIVNQKWGRDLSKPHVHMNVRCTSPIYADYGDNLDMDFIVHNGSEEVPLTCQGFSLDETGSLIQGTDQVSIGRTSSPVRLQASQRKTYGNAKPVMIMANCSIPDRGTIACGSFDCNPRYDISKLLNIKVY